MKGFSLRTGEGEEQEGLEGGEGVSGVYLQAAPSNLSSLLPSPMWLVCSVQCSVCHM